ncbi:hypothetical protein [Streptomyces aureocirculatus]|uniref:hypothetical protein n=1 Tax=Streptomyces aureocirculatus TaxID=67275 RepID=UPI000A68C6F4|nr:hypothetical protein [Streptomyces aureocirculatus]
MIRIGKPPPGAPFDPGSTAGGTGGQGEAATEAHAMAVSAAPTVTLERKRRVFAA